MAKQLTGKTSDFLRIVLPACSTGKLALVKKFVQDERGFVHWIGPHGRTMLWEAARKGKLDVVKLLVEEAEADPHAIGCYYRETNIEVSPWLVAKLNRRESTVDYFESIGAGLDYHSACYLGDQEFVNQILDQDPKQVNTPYQRDHRWNGYIVWPLQYAIVGGQQAMVEHLIERGADPRQSPQILFDAINTDQPTIAEMLLKAGADPLLTRHRDWFEKPIYNAIARRYGFEIREIDVPPEKWPRIVDESRGNHNAPDDPQRVERLIEAGHDVNVRDYKGKTALHRASQAGFAEISKLLVQHGADLEARSHEGETPLFDAAFYGRTNQIEFLVAQGADIEAMNHNEETPVFAAIRGGQAQSVLILHGLGASLLHVNVKNKSIYDLAEKSNKIGIDEVRKVLKKLQ